jgi:hypothetical protein
MSVDICDAPEEHMEIYLVDTQSSFADGGVCFGNDILQLLLRFRVIPDESRNDRCNDEKSRTSLN